MLATIVKNTEVKCKSNDPDWHLFQVSWRKGAEEHVLLCEGSLKELAISTVGTRDFVAQMSGIKI